MARGLDEPVPAAMPPIPDEPLRATSTGCEDVRFHWEDPGCEPATLVDLDEVVQGGPPPDGIPPVELEAGGDDVVVLWTPGQASALDSRAIDDGREVGQTGAYRPVVDGQRVALEADGDRFVDTVSGSTFDVRGRAVDGPLAGQRLEPVIHDDTFWFVWMAFRGDGRVVS